MIISLIWVFNVSRTAQLVHSHLETRRKNAEGFGLSGHTKIFMMDKKSPAPIILRHRNLRLIGFWIYFSLLLNFKFKFTTFREALIATGLSAGFSLIIWGLYFWELPRSSGKVNLLISIVIFMVLFVLLTWMMASLLDQPDSNAYLKRGLDYVAQGDYEEAIGAFTSAIEMKPDYVPTYVLRGEAYRAKYKDNDDKANDAQSRAETDWIKANALRKTQ